MEQVFSAVVAHFWKGTARPEPSTTEADDELAMHETVGFEVDEILTGG